jgi:predicted GIY-YIG superfamily endonuclease
MMWHVYVLYNPLRSSRAFYIGVTNNLKQRFEKHRAGEVRFTRRDAAGWHLVYVETFVSKKDAVMREQRLKNHGQALRQLKGRISRSILELRNRCGMKDKR